MRRFRFAALLCAALAEFTGSLAAGEPTPVDETPPAEFRLPLHVDSKQHPREAPPAAPATENTVPQLTFLLDYLYAQSAWNGQLSIPYRPDITLRLADLLSPEEAQALTAAGPSPTVVAGFREAEQTQGGALTQAYLAQLRALAAGLPEADQPLANKLIDGMLQYQTAIHRPNRLFAPPEPLPAAPTNAGYRRIPAPPAEALAPEELPPAEAPAAAAPDAAAEPAALAPEEIDRLRRQADRGHNETWLQTLSAAELARVAAYLADPKSEIAGVRYYDRTLRLYIGRTPARLSDLFNASAEFRHRERLADLAWKRQLVTAAGSWQKTIAVLRSIAAQEQAAQTPAAIRPGLIAVLKTYHASLAAQQALQNQYESDLLALTQPTLPADQRAVLEKRRDGYPNAMRALIEQYGRDLETAYTVPLEKAVIDFYKRTNRLNYVKEHLHEQGKAVMEKAEAPNGDQF